MRPPGVYVTGTDTGVGKSLASVALLHAWRGQGLRASGMKPVASGSACIGGQWRNDDALALLAASEPGTRYEDVNPYALPAPTAPQLAAREAGVEVVLAPIGRAFARLAAACDMVVVEGVGGWLAPLADGLEQSDVVRALELPVVVVVGLRLGCLSHARLTARAVVADGARLAGWIASAVDPGFERSEAYLGLLRDALGPVPCLGVLAHAPQPDPERLARDLTLTPP